jgi:hypothetical protein
VAAGGTRAAAGDAALMGFLCSGALTELHARVTAFRLKGTAYVEGEKS